MPIAQQTYYRIISTTELWRTYHKLQLRIVMILLLHKYAFLQNVDMGRGNLSTSHMDHGPNGPPLLAVQNFRFS